MAHPRQKIYIIGDQALVEEFGRLCVESGFQVMGAINRYSQKIPLPKFIKKSASPPRTIPLAVELTNLDVDQKKKNVRFLENKFARSCTIVSSSVTVTAIDQQSDMRFPSRLIGIGALPTLATKKLIEIAPSVHTTRETVARANEFFAKLGKETAIVQDRVGMVMPRILCSLINEACFAATENIASAGDIDTAMKLGTNYPSGPFEWADSIGFDHVFAVINALNNDLREDRYRAAPLLKHMAAGKRWWNT